MTTDKHTDEKASARQPVESTQAEQDKLQFGTGKTGFVDYPYVWQYELEQLQRQLEQMQAHATALAEALRGSADKLNDLSEWLKAYAEPKQALSVSAIESEAREALANWEAAQ